MLCLALALAILGGLGADYALSFRREAAQIAAAPARGMDVPAAAQAGKINVNTATAADFQQAEGIGPVLAQAIVDYRDSLGGFLFLEELKDVPGVGDKRFEALEQLFYCPSVQGAAE